MTPAIPVTDHAVLRWLERECGVPVETIRRLIGEGCAPHVSAKPEAVIVGKVKFIIQDGKVITTLSREMRQKRRRMKKQ